MFNQLPTTVQEFKSWEWSQIEPYQEELKARTLTPDNVIDWLTDWSRLSSLIGETYNRLYVATTVDTTDEAAVSAYHAYVENVIPYAQAANQTLKQKLLDSGIEPPDYWVELRDLRTEADLFREENIPLFTEESKLGTEFDKVIGAQTVMWEGEEKTLPAMKPIYQDADRSKREQAWMLASNRQLADRGTLNELWGKFLKLRLQMAANADMADFRAYRWRDFKRYDYTPEDCETFHRAIEEVAVPAAQRIYERRRKQLGVETLRPWDLNVDPLGREPLKPFTDAEQLDSITAQVFHKVDPRVGEYYDIMRREGLLNLPNRKGKAPGGYCTFYPVVKRPFIFMNAVGIHDDVQTLLHEGGHAFHAFEAAKLPDFRSQGAPIEFCEVASMSMELLAAPYFTKEQGGYYDSAADAARARIEHLESVILFWPYMAVVDSFQQWVYTHQDEAADPANCDRVWGEQWDRFMKGIDYTGLEDAKVTGWHRKLHIFQIPFYYVEYGLAQLGAVQVWRNSLKNQSQAIADYLAALALGGTQPLPKLFERAGAKFAFDAGTMRECVDLCERTINELEA
ncbi:MAG: M3 family oligoendopeptidase [Anaerolinea sp.]|nr:M3 family oligoendopeptidase [Anaerolinea sp.]